MLLPDGLSVQFPVNVANVEIDRYMNARSVTAAVVIKDFPLAGAGAAEVWAPHPVKSIMENPEPDLVKWSSTWCSQEPIAHAEDLDREPGF